MSDARTLAAASSAASSAACTRWCVLISALPRAESVGSQPPTCMRPGLGGSASASWLTSLIMPLATSHSWRSCTACRTESTARLSCASSHSLRSTSWRRATGSPVKGLAFRFCTPSGPDFARAIFGRKPRQSDSSRLATRGCKKEWNCMLGGMVFTQAAARREPRREQRATRAAQNHVLTSVPEGGASSGRRRAAGRGRPRGARRLWRRRKGSKPGDLRMRHRN